MFKKLFKARQDATTVPVQGFRVLNKQEPSYLTNPVEYGCFGPTYNPSPSYSINPVEYVQSPVPGYACASAVASPTPVVYAQSVPTPSQLNPSTAQIHRQVHELGSGDSIEPAGNATESRCAYYPPAELSNMSDRSPTELPASPVPPVYGLPNVNTTRWSPVTPHPPPSSTRHSPNAGWSSSANGTSTSVGSATTLVPSPHSPLRSPPLNRTKTPTWTSPIDNENNKIKKFLVDIYCPLRRDANGVHREQIPRDVREFRLAKIALIPIVAGKRSFVSFDVVFGEMDKTFSNLVEKHFSFCYDTRIATLEPGAVSGGQVTTIGPLNIAYRDGGQSTVYLKFPTTEDQNRFKADFFDMWQYVEQTVP